MCMRYSYPGQEISLQRTVMKTADYVAYRLTYEISQLLALSGFVSG